MRAMIATMLLPLLAVVGVEIFSRTADVSATTVAAPASTAAAAVCRIDGTGRLRLVEGNDDRPLAEPHQMIITRSGGLTAYAALTDRGLDVILCSDAGNVLHRVQLPASEVGSAMSVGRVRLLSASRAFVELRVNPSASLGLLLDLRTGDRRTFEGHSFAVSPDGRDVAHFREPPHFAPSGGGTASVCVNGRELQQIPRGSGQKLSWLDGRQVKAKLKSSLGHVTETTLAVGR